MARRSFKAGTLTAPLPAVMVTVGDMEKSNVITIAWTGILSSDPPRTYISVRPSRHSHAMLLENGEFVINLTNERLALATDYAGIYTGAKVDKFEKCHLTKEKSEKVAPPTIKESPIALECKVYEVVHSGTHDVFMADIVNISCDESILDASGRISFDRENLIAYAHGEYFALGKKLGRFGFSTDKKNRQKAAKPQGAAKKDAGTTRGGAKHRTPKKKSSKGKKGGKAV